MGSPQRTQAGHRQHSLRFISTSAERGSRRVQKGVPEARGPALTVSHASSFGSTVVWLLGNSRGYWHAQRGKTPVQHSPRPREPGEGWQWRERAPRGSLRPEVRRKLKVEARRLLGSAWECASVGELRVGPCLPPGSAPHEAAGRWCFGQAERTRDPECPGQARLGPGREKAHGRWGSCGRRVRRTRGHRSACEAVPETRR